MNHKCSKDFEGTEKAPGDERDPCSRGLRVMLIRQMQNFHPSPLRFRSCPWSFHFTHINNSIHHYVHQLGSILVAEMGGVSPAAHGKSGHGLSC